MSETYILVTITLFEPQLNDERLQEAVFYLREEVEEVDGVKRADLIPVEEAPSGSKGLGGFLLGKLKAVVYLKNLKALVKFLSIRRPTIEIEAEGNGRRLKVKISRPEDLIAVMPEVNKFIEGQEVTEDEGRLASWS